MKNFLVLIIFLSSSAFSYEKADAFIVTAFSQYYKVLSPVKVEKNIGFIFKNKTLVPIVGKLVSDEEGDIKIIKVKPGKEKSFNFPYSKSNKYKFIPLSPPFQSVALKTGEKSYEVPSQKESR